MLRRFVAGCRFHHVHAEDTLGMRNRLEMHPGFLPLQLQRLPILVVSTVEGPACNRPLTWQDSRNLGVRGLKSSGGGKSVSRVVGVVVVCPVEEVPCPRDGLVKRAAM